MLLGFLAQGRSGQRCLPFRRRVCVLLVITGIPLNCFFFLAEGMRLSRKRMPTKLCVIVEARSDQPGVPAFFELLNLCKGLVSSADLHATTSPCRSDSGLRFGPHFLLKTPRLFRAFLGLSGFGFLGWGVGPHSHQYAFLKVCVCVCVSPSVSRSLTFFHRFAGGLAAHFSTLANETREMGGWVCGRTDLYLLSNC